MADEEKKKENSTDSTTQSDKQNQGTNPLRVRLVTHGFDHSKLTTKEDKDKKDG